MLEERDEILEEVGRDWHYNNYGMEDAIVTGSGVSDGLVQKVVNALAGSPYGNKPALDSKFVAGQVNIIFSIFKKLPRRNHIRFLWFLLNHSPFNFFELLRRFLQGS